MSVETSAPAAATPAPPAVSFLGAAAAAAPPAQPPADAGVSSAASPAPASAAPEGAASEGAAPPAADASAVPDPLKAVPEDGVYDLGLPPETINSAMLASMAPAMKQAGVTQAQARELAGALAAYNTQIAQAVEQQNAAWRGEIDADPVLGGGNRQAAEAAVKAALNTFDPKGEVTQLLEQTGLGNHPAIARLLHAVGTRVMPDMPTRGGAVSGKREYTQAEINAMRYPTIAQ